jgi:hypothetical protein
MKKMYNLPINIEVLDSIVVAALVDDYNTLTKQINSLKWASDPVAVADRNDARRVVDAIREVLRYYMPPQEWKRFNR